MSSAPPSVPEPPVEPDDTFHRLTQTGKGQPVQAESSTIAEPNIDEDATIRELVSGQSTSVSTAPSTIPEAETPESAVARLALDIASDDTILMEDVTLPKFIGRLEEEMSDTGASRPVPAWVEPVISSEDTQPSERLRVAMLVPPLPEDTQSTGELEQPEQTAQVDEEITDSPVMEPESVEPEPQEQLVAVAVDDEMPPVAALAVQLTQLSVDLASEVTLVTRGDTLVASAGDLPPIALAGVVDTINAMWEGSSDDASSFVRFIHVPGLGDYLLYSTPTTDEMILSMLFPAETPLKVIRKQARELMTALESVPDQPSESEAARTLLSRPTDPFPPQGLREAIAAETEGEMGAESAEEAIPADEPTAEPQSPRAEGPYTAYAFVWLPRHDPLDPDLATSLLGWIDSIAKGHVWQLEGTDIQSAYVSVQVSIPANETPTATVEALMQETSVNAGKDDLWADAYYIVAPGRAVTEQEIASFMEYRRDAQDAA